MTLTKVYTKVYTKVHTKISSTFKNKIFRNILKSFSVISLGTFINKTLSYFRDVFLASWLGTTNVADAFVIASHLPNIAKKFATDGVFNAMLIPQIKKTETENPKATPSFIAYILCIFFAASVLMCFLLILFSNKVLLAFYPGSISNPERLKWAMYFLPFTALTIVPTVISDIFSSVLNYYGVYFPAVASSLFWNSTFIICICSCIYFHLDFNYLGMICILACLAQTFVIFRAYRQLNIPFEFKCNVKKELKHFGKKFLPIVCTGSIRQINTCITTAMLSFLPHGNISILFRVERIVLLPITFISGFNMVLLPLIVNNLHKEKYIFRILMITISVLSLITLILTYYWGFRAVKFLYLRGNMKIDDIVKMSELLFILILETPAIIGIKIAQMFFFARQNTRISTIGAVIQITTNLSIMLAFLGKYGIVAIAYASVISSWAHCLFLILLIQYHHYTKKFV